MSPGVKGDGTDFADVDRAGEKPPADNEPPATDLDTHTELSDPKPYEHEDRHDLLDLKPLITDAGIPARKRGCYRISEEAGAESQSSDPQQQVPAAMETEGAGRPGRIHRVAAGAARRPSVLDRQPAAIQCWLSRLRRLRYRILQARRPARVRVVGGHAAAIPPLGRQPQFWRPVAIKVLTGYLAGAAHGNASGHHPPGAATREVFRALAASTAHPAWPTVPATSAAADCMWSP